MKKGIFLLCVAILCLLFTTGCDNKTIVKCETKVNDATKNYNISFIGNKINSIDLEIDLSGYSNEQIDAIKDQDLCSDLKSEVEEIKDALSDCKQTIEEKKLSINATFDVNKIPGNQLNKMYSPENAKKDLENSGYKCTIEK